MCYFFIASVFYLLFIHINQRRLHKKELLTNVNTQYKTAIKRFKLWVFGHANKMIFLLISLTDMTLEIFTTSISSNGQIVVNSPASVMTLSCAQNGSIRYILYMTSNFVFSLFCYSKCALVFSLMQYDKCLHIFIKITLWYIILTYPVLQVWGLCEIQYKHWNMQHDGMLCIN